MGKYYYNNIHFKESSTKILLQILLQKWQESELRYRVGFTTKQHVLRKYYLPSLSHFFKCKMSCSVSTQTDIENQFNYVYENTWHTVYWLLQPIQNSTPECANLSHPCALFILLFFLEMKLYWQYTTNCSKKRILKTTNDN